MIIVVIEKTKPKKIILAIVIDTKIIGSIEEIRKSSTLIEIKKIASIYC